MFGKKKNIKIGISQKQLIIRLFFKHKLAIISLWLLGVFYIFAIFPGFLTPYTANERFSDYYYAKPTPVHFFHKDGSFSLRPFIYGKKVDFNKETWERVISEDLSKISYIKFFVKGRKYSILGLLNTNIHLFGTGDPKNPVYLFGSDQLGRDIFSRIVYGGTISLTIGLIGVFFSLILGIIIGGISGLIGGFVDSGIQRLIDIILSIPTIPLWMALRLHHYRRIGR